MRGLLTLATLASGALGSVWPLPVSYEKGEGVVFIDGHVGIQYNGSSMAGGSHGWASQSGSSWTDRIVHMAIERTYDTLFNKNIYPWRFHQRMTDFLPERTANSTMVHTISLVQTAQDPADIMKPALGSVDESYHLHMSTSGAVTITAASSIGLAYGLTTFTQLFYTHSLGCAYSTEAPVTITDKPSYGWRGLNVDTARTFKPMSDMYSIVDGLAYNKMNRLHWHVTDAQSWPLEIPTLPGLADKGAYATFQRYSPADVLALQEYGASVGVEVVMEIDQPGHTAAIWFAYPDLITAFNAKPWNVYCAEPPCGQLRLNDTAVYTFLETLFSDLLPRLKPLTQYFHLGGDELNLEDYTLDPTIGTNSSEVIVPLLQKFMNRNMAQLKANGFTPLVWQEMLLQWNLTLPKDTIVQTWASNEAVAETVKKGYRALVGNYEYWYLDCGKGQWIDFYPSVAAEYWPFKDYCAPYKNWRLMYSLDPQAGVPANLSHLVVGGETHIWSEQTDSVNLENMVWPRTCAAGEILWSGAKDAQGQNRSQVEAAPRLSEMRERLVARGIRAEPVQMPFCLMNGTQCTLPSLPE